MTTIDTYLIIVIILLLSALSIIGLEIYKAHKEKKEEKRREEVKELRDWITTQIIINKEKELQIEKEEQKKTKDYYDKLFHKQCDLIEKQQEEISILKTDIERLDIEYKEVYIEDIVYDVTKNKKKKGIFNLSIIPDWYIIYNLGEGSKTIYKFIKNNEK